ncbi:pilus assembly protein PilM [Candidatus Saccharibacteria bacterium]|nr:pilus assembly protein PilM [Candidatus Saccharibacteria bacterium]
MSLINGLGEFFAIDIGTNSLRVVQLTGSRNAGWTLQHFGYVPIAEGLVQDDSNAGRQAFMSTVKMLVDQSGITTKNCVIGLPSNKAFTSVIKVPTQDEADLKKTMMYQMDSLIPTALSDAEIDWKDLGPIPSDPENTNILLSSTPSAFAESRLDLFEDAGFNVYAAEPEVIAMTRALYPFDASDARLIVDYGEATTDIAVYYHGAPRLLRSVPLGLRDLVKVASTSLSIKEDQARQFLLKFGLAQDKLDGKIFVAINAALDTFIYELAKVVRTFNTNFPDVPIGGAIVANYGEAIPLMLDYISTKLKMPVDAANPWRKVAVPPEYRDALRTVATEFAVVLGLAERTNDVPPYVEPKKWLKLLNFQALGEKAAKASENILEGAKDPTLPGGGAK